jgi:hypothetical protein
MSRIFGAARTHARPVAPVSNAVASLEARRESSSFSSSTYLSGQELIAAELLAFVHLQFV